MKLDRAREKILSADYVREILDYNPVTGLFTWKLKTHPKSNKLVGLPAGCNHNKGYAMITILKKRYYAHRLAWLYMTGSWPEGVIDHRDRNTSNNVFSNLYVVSVSGNGHNMKPTPDPNHPVRGIRKRGNNWSARIRVRGQDYYLGSFGCYKDAAEAVRTRKIELNALS